jgi:hypothetical protein
MGSEPEQFERDSSRAKPVTLHQTEKSGWRGDSHSHKLLASDLTPI